MMPFASMNVLFAAGGDLLLAEIGDQGDVVEDGVGARKKGATRLGSTQKPAQRPKMANEVRSAARSIGCRSYVLRRPSRAPRARRQVGGG